MNGRTWFARVLLSLTFLLPQAAMAEGADTSRRSGQTPDKAAPTATARQSRAGNLPPGATRIATDEPSAVAAYRDEKNVNRPAQRVRDISFSQKADRFEVRLKADGEIGRYTLLELENPPRLAIDLDGFRRGVKERITPDEAPISKVRSGRHDSHVRLVLDSKDGFPLPRYDVKRLRDGLVISMQTEALAARKSPAPSAKVVAQAPAAKSAEKPQSEAKAAGKPLALSDIRDISYSGDKQGGRVLIAVGKGVTHSLEQPDPRTAILTIKGARLPKKLAQNLDTSSHSGPVTMVSAFSAPGKDDTVQVVATLDDTVAGTVHSDRSGILVWEIKRASASPNDPMELVVDGRAVSLKTPEVESAVTTARASALAAEAPDPNAAAGAPTQKPRRGKYRGQRISFEFKDIDIHNLLRIFADISKKNVIVGDNVSGKVTIKLRNVPWDQALDIVLKSKGLDKEEYGNIIRIAPAKLLEDERRQAAEKAKMQVQLEPLKVRIIPINYATASGLADRVKDVLSDRGKLSVDARTNVIIVKDIEEAIARAEGLVRRLDTQTPQVLIESRIVEASVNFSREFGIQWGGDLNFGPNSGNSTGLAFPNTIRVSGAAGNEGTDGLGTTTPNYAINLPAAIGMGAGGGLGFTFGSAGGAALLNLRLSAMESSGQSKTISAPRVITLDNNTATISQGISIPYSQTSASGVNTTFVEAKLELKVTPHVTADGSILLDINASNNQADSSMTGANGQPAISKKEAQTQVLVKDGDTTVIGGIYTRSQGSNESGVPLFSRIPVLGWLFKNRSESDTRTELLIFITPRIVNRNQSMAADDLPAAL